MKKIIATTTILSFLMFSCNTKTSENLNNDDIVLEENNTLDTQDTIMHDEHNARTSLDWAGVYQGTIPCADCPGIKTTVELTEDEQMLINSEYLERDNKFTEEGKFTWTADGNAIYLDTKDHNRYFYKVEENRLVMLNQEGMPIEGAIAEHYILTKQ